MAKHLLATIAALALASTNCRSMAGASPTRARYIVTSAPISVTGGPGGLCVALDPSDPVGVWWWQAGRTGCSSRMTSPGPRNEGVPLAGIFHPTDGTVSSSASGHRSEARFRLGLHGPPDFVDVDLIVEDGYMRSTTTGARVSVTRTDKLDIPLLPRG